jgi:drug/metabolite transporter (DMT)-like permease
MQIHPDVIVGTALGFTMSLIWAFSNNVYNSQSDKIKPIAIASFKMWLAFVVIGIIVIWQIQFAPFIMPFESAFFIGLSVAVGTVIGDTMYLSGQERIGVAYAYPITNAFPIITYILSIIFLSEELLLTRLLGIIVAILGITMITNELVKNRQVEKNSFNRLGIPLVICASIMYAISTILLQVGVAEVDPIYASFIRVLLGSVLFVPVFVIARIHGMPKPPRKSTKIVLVGAFFGMAIGSLIYVSVVKLVGATFASVMTSLSPLFALPISIFVLKEKFTARAGIGVILAIMGVILVILGV